MVRLRATESLAPVRSITWSESEVTDAEADGAAQRVATEGGARQDGVRADRQAAFAKAISRDEVCS
jgi:hypothetical protein